MRTPPLLLSPLLLLSGCFTPDYGSPSFACGTSGECPTGYECHKDGLCYRLGTPDLDGGDGDGGSDSRMIDAPPAPDDYCPSTTLLEEGVVKSVSLAGASGELSTTCTGAPLADLFYELVLTEERSVTIDLSSIVAMGVALHATDCTTELACAAPASGGATLPLDSLPAGTYQVQVYSAAASGDFSLVYTTGAPIPRPPNDGCAGAVTLTDGVPRTDQSIRSARDDSTGSCANGGDVVYTFTVPPSMNKRARVTVSNATFDAGLHLEAACGAGPELLCANTGSGDTDVLDAFDLAPGSYTVWVEVASGNTGTFDIVLELLDAVPPPAHDTCGGAEALPLGTTRSSSTIGALDQIDLACVADGPDVVHQFALGAAAATLITITPSSVWPLAADLRAQAACETAATSCLPGGFGDLPRYFNQPSLAMGTYDVVVDGAAGGAGDYTIRVDTRAPDPTFGYWLVESSRSFGSIAGGVGAVMLPVETTNVLSSGTIYTPPDDGEYLVNLPFDFPYFGSTWTSAYVDVNGFLSRTVLSGAPSYSNDCPFTSASDPYELIATLWDDRWAVVGAEIWTRQEGTAPNRRFVIEWKDFDFLDCSPMCRLLGARITEQVILYENGDIQIHYGPRTPPSVSQGCDDQHLGCSATIGLRGPGPSGDTDAYPGCNTSTATTGKLLTFVRPR